MEPGEAPQDKALHLLRPELSCQAKVHGEPHDPSG